MRDEPRPLVQLCIASCLRTRTLPSASTPPPLPQDGDDGVPSGISWAPYWMLEEALEACAPARSCGLTAELGASCQAAGTGAELGCCTSSAQGGHPAARCLYPPEVEAPSACVAKCPAGQTALPGGCCRTDRVCGGACCASGTCLDGRTCCPAGRACGSTCCSLGSTCVGSSCCPSPRACSKTCCAAGQTCDRYGRCVRRW